MNIKKLLINQAKEYASKPAVVFADSQVNFLQMKDASFKFANHLADLGLKKSDKVAIFLPNTPKAIFVFLGVFSSGFCVVPLDFMLAEKEVIDFINHSQASVFVAENKRGIDIKKIKDSCPLLKETIVFNSDSEEYSSGELILQEGRACEPCADIDENGLAAIFYTSGSTGHPKGVMLNYSHLGNPCKVIDYFLKVSSGDVFLCGGVPFSHLGGVDYILLMVNFAATLVLMERFQPREFLKNITQHKVTIFCIVPAMYVAILSLKEYNKFDLSSLRYAVVFGAPSSPVLLKRFNKAYPKACLSNGWGMTETAAPNCMLSKGVNKIESIGKFAPGMEAKIIDDEGICLGPNQRGELLVRGKAVTPGYYREENLTKQAFTVDGWFKTGDIACYDEDSLFYIVGRKKEMIKVAGEIVFLAEVEEKINSCPKVKEAAVIGVSDKLRGEVPKAFVVIGDNEYLEEKELKDFLKEKMATFKIPHYFEFVKDLPKNRTGKVDKARLVHSR